MAHSDDPQDPCQEIQRAALVVGGSGDIGRAIALRLGALGYGVVISGRDADRLNETRERLTEAGVTVQLARCDITDGEAVNEMVASAAAWRGRLDVVVNAAGIAPTGMLLRADMARWEQALATNLLGAVTLSRAALGVMRRQREGLIVHVGSLAAHESQSGLAPYAASKAALHSLAGSLRLEAQRFGIRVSVIAPDKVDTRMHPQDARQNETMLSPEDVAETLAFLLRLSPAARVDEIVLRTQTRQGASPP